MSIQASEVYVDENENLDKVLLGLQRKEVVTRIILGPGTFVTQGAWAMDPATHYQSVRGNVQILGQGSDRTRILLEDPVVTTGRKRRPDVPIIRIGNDFTPASGGGISGVTIDGNWRENRGRCYVTAGVRGFGTCMRFEDVRVRGVYGTRESLPVQEGSSERLQFEAFGISTMTPLAAIEGDETNDGGHVGKDCVVENTPEDSYLSAFSFGTMPGFRGNKFAARWISKRSHWINCRAEVGQRNHAAFTLYHNTHVVGGSSAGFYHAFYNDTESASDCFVEGGWHSVGYTAATLVHGGGAFLPEKRDVLIRGTVFRFNKWHGSNGNAIGLALIRDPKRAQPEGGFRGIAMEGCRFDVQDGLLWYPFSTSATRIEDIAIRNCVEVGGIRKSPHFSGPVEGVLEYVPNHGMRELFSAKSKGE